MIKKEELIKTYEKAIKELTYLSNLDRKSIIEKEIFKNTIDFYKKEIYSLKNNKKGAN